MKNINQTLTSPLGRAFVYLSIFIAGSALHELIFRLIYPTIGSNSALLLTLLTVGVFTLIGALLANERHIRSQITSAATLFILSFIALKIGRSAVPDPYFLVIALCVAFFGAQQALHRNLKGFKQTALYGVLTTLVSLVIVFTFVSSVAIFDRTTIQQQSGSHAY